MTFDFGGKAFQDGFAQKVANLICFLCGLCVSLRLSALKGPLTQRTQRYAEIRRGPQRKDFHLNSIFCAKPRDPIEWTLERSTALILVNLTRRWRFMSRLFPQTNDIPSARSATASGKV